MDTRILVTGARGFVAGSVLAQGRSRAECHAVSRTAAPDPGPDGTRWHALDSRAEADWDRLISTVRPTAIIHTAAVADVNFCEVDPDAALAINAGLTGTLARLCARHGVKLVHCSTDTVFDGERAPYAEDDVPEPINRYGETKAAAERAVQEAGGCWAVARLSLVVGLPAAAAGNSTLSRMLDAFRAGRTVGGLVTEYRTPIDLVTVGRALLELALGAPTGLFHLSGLTRLSRYDLTCRIARAFGFPESLVEAQTTMAQTGRARRPRDVSMSHARARALLATPMREFDDALRLVRETPLCYGTG